MSWLENRARFYSDAVSPLPKLDHFSCEIEGGRNLLSSWIEYFGCLIPRLSLVLAENRMSRRVEFGAMGSIYAIAGDVVEPSFAFLDRILWMLDSVNLPSLLTVGCLVSAFHLGLWYRSMQSPVRLSNYPVIHSCFSFCCSHASNIHISSFERF